MLNYKIIAVGKKHADYLSLGINYFQDRLQPYAEIEWFLIPHSSVEGKNEAEIIQARTSESAAILEKVQKLKTKHSSSLAILLDERGQNLTSPALAQKIQTAADQGISQIIFIIGGAYGVTPELRQQVNQVWSFSQLVFPHQLMRLILLEQLYRAQMILAGKKYHHE